MPKRLESQPERSTAPDSSPQRTYVRTFRNDWRVIGLKNQAAKKRRRNGRRRRIVNATRLTQALLSCSSNSNGGGAERRTNFPPVNLWRKKPHLPLPPTKQDAPHNKNLRP